jgi:hypothetical protein
MRGVLIDLQAQQAISPTARTNQQKAFSVDICQHRWQSTSHNQFQRPDAIEKASPKLGMLAKFFPTHLHHVRLWRNNARD